MKGTKALVVVAHCDDAPLWMGGTIHRLREWEWQIFSLCERNSEERRRAFYESCRMLRVKRSFAFDFHDYQSGGAFSLNSREDMKRRLTSCLDADYDYVFTHSLQEWNEYGHNDNHHEVGIVVSELAREKSWSLIQFCYRALYSSGIATVANERADSYVQLDYNDLKYKLEVINCFLPGELKNLRGLGYPCPNPEAFEGKGLPNPPFTPAARA